jgi:hypothetical protein
MLLNIEGNPVFGKRVLRGHQISGHDWVPGLRPLAAAAVEPMVRAALLPTPR